MSIYCAFYVQLCVRQLHLSNHAETIVKIEIVVIQQFNWNIPNFQTKTKSEVNGQNNDQKQGYWRSTLRFLDEAQVAVRDWNQDQNSDCWTDQDRLGLLEKTKTQDTTTQHSYYWTRLNSVYYKYKRKTKTGGIGQVQNQGVEY